MADPEAARSPDATGVSHALIAYGIWGFAPIYWKETAQFPAPELLAYRVLAGLAVAVCVVLATGVYRDVLRVLRSPRASAAVALACVLIASNWLVFIYAVQTDRILDTSLGYYINPLVNVLVGLALLGERLTRAQGIAVSIAALGVGYQTWQHGSLPWISLALACTFGLYGLVRKLAPAKPLAGFGLETLMLAPFALGFLVWLAGSSEAVVPGASAGMMVLIAASGLLTAAPLVAFASAANRLPLSTLGMFQYIAPTLAFGVAVAFYGEVVTGGQAVSFGCVWVALALFSWDSFQRARVSVDLPTPAAEPYPVKLGGTPEVDR